LQVVKREAKTGFYATMNGKMQSAKKKKRFLLMKQKLFPQKNILLLAQNKKYLSFIWQ